jgi:RNA polymerase sigma-70 factor (ECF subfamily)
MDARQAAEAVARVSYGRLLAYLSVRSRDVIAAEDALSDALRAALETWPLDGVPKKPEAWLLSVARRKLIDNIRHEQVHSSAKQTLLLFADDIAPDTIAFPDERLKLLFVCAHPAIDPGARTPLMLQTVLGLDAARIASAFLIAPAAMSQRLVRAKAKIRDANIAFEVPEISELADRLEAVLDAVYAVYGAAWEYVAGVDPQRGQLVEEALWLARLLVELLPDEPEAKGLLALLLHCESRRAARRSRDGSFVPLSEQDADRWSRPMMIEAEQLLGAAVAQKRMGRFQLEAAIQSAHAERARNGRVERAAIVQLYDGLIAIAPSIGALLGRAAAVASMGTAQEALALIDEIPPVSIGTYQPYWALRGHLLERLGRAQEAKAAYGRAIGLTEDAAVREFLVRRISFIESDQ